MPQDNGLTHWTGLATALLEGDRYRPLSWLGQRGGRQTLVAQDLATGQKVVVKILGFGEGFAWDDLKLFEREAELLRSLDHPGIPRYLDYFDLEAPNLKGFALVQSYIEARSLAQHLQAGRTFSEEEIGQISDAMLQILDYLHHRQPAVIHRDIKPSNILLSDRTAHSVGDVYLVDFGSVQTMAAREGSTVTVVGTYGYMPPEQFGGRAVPASDLYSLGATLICLASGRHPAELPQDDLKIQFEDFVRLSPARVAWLKYLTEPSLERRVGSVQEAEFKSSSIKPEISGSSPNLETDENKDLTLSFRDIKAEYHYGKLFLYIPQKQISIFKKGEFDYSESLYRICLTISICSALGCSVGLILGNPLIFLPFAAALLFSSRYLAFKKSKGSILLKVNRDRIYWRRFERHQEKIKLTKGSYIKKIYKPHRFGEFPDELQEEVEINTIQLETETHILEIRTYSAKELQWLDEILCNATGLPEESENKYLLDANQ